ncbi:hypothetical protein [Methanoregula sp.]|uniref:hypothetical protein n=1 Tax=Methanoregula sp. TaxID=2052170 RepID=UPI0025D987E7|nr:hypothetical protein [Methanoregula sp.]
MPTAAVSGESGDCVAVGHGVGTVVTVVRVVFTTGAVVVGTLVATVGATTVKDLLPTYP